MGVSRRWTSQGEATGTSRWAAIPIGTNVIGGFDEVANQTLNYEIVMDKEVEFSGPISAHLCFSCNEIDSHIVARLGRVDAAGGYHLLCMGTISPARRRIDKARSTSCEIAIDTGVREPLTPGEPVALAFSLTPAPMRLGRGEKLQVDVARRTDPLSSDAGPRPIHFHFTA